MGPDAGKRPGTFDFLGFTHHFGRSRKGKPTVRRKTAKDRFRRSLKRVAQWCREHRHDDLRVQQKVLAQKLRGHHGYFGIVGNYAAMRCFLNEVQLVWCKWIRPLSGGRCRSISLSEPNALDLSTRDRLRRPVVELRRLRARVTGNLGRRLDASATGHVRRDPRRPEAVVAHQHPVDTLPPSQQRISNMSLHQRISLASVTILPWCERLRRHATVAAGVLRRWA